MDKIINQIDYFYGSIGILYKWLCSAFYKRDLLKAFQKAGACQQKRTNTEILRNTIPVRVSKAVSMRIRPGKW